MISASRFDYDGSVGYETISDCFMVTHPLRIPMFQFLRYLEWKYNNIFVIEYYNGFLLERKMHNQYKMIAQIDYSYEMNSALRFYNAESCDYIMIHFDDFNNFVQQIIDINENYSNKFDD